MSGGKVDDTAEIKVTLAMIEAGSRELRHFSPSDDGAEARADVLESIYVAMERARLAELPDPWRPIETAPKDETAVLLGERTWSRAYEGRWMQGNLTTVIGAGRPITRREGWWLSCNGTLAEPTHWQPLPEPPK